MNLITNDGREGADMCAGSGSPMDWDHDDDAATDPMVLCSVDLGMYFDDPNPGDMLTYTHSFMGVNKAAKSLEMLSDSVLGANLVAKPAAGDAQHPYPNTIEEIRAGAVAAHEYTPATVEVMATDTEDLWTTQTFMVMRNRRPVILPSDLETTFATQIAATDAPDDVVTAATVPGPPTTSIVVGTAGDGTVTKDNHHKVDIAGTDIFADDDSFVMDADIDDYEIASHGDRGAKITVYGEMQGMTDIHLVAEDSGGLLSRRHKVTIHVDPAPTLHKDNRLLSPITAILEQGQPVLVIDNILQYFDQVVPVDATNVVVGEGEAITITDATTVNGTVCATSDNIAVAVPLTVVAATGTTPACHGVARAVESGDAPRWSVGDLVIELKSIGNVEIVVTATEPADADNSDITGFTTPQQSAALSFELIVQAE